MTGRSIGILQLSFLSAILIIFAVLPPFPLPNATSAQAEESSAPKNNIRGYISDKESGEALPYANILLKGSSLGAASNTNGYFVILNAPARLCTLEVSYIGYNPIEIIIDNSTGEGSQVAVKMSRALLESGEVTVTAYRQMLEISDEVSQVTLAPNQIAALPNIGEVDIFRALQLLPGISGVNDGSSGLYVRGGTPDQNLVMLDGMTIYHVDHFYGFFSAFNADAIKDIQVYKGGFPAEYGGRISSVVDLTGKTGNINNFRAGIGANLLSAHAVAEIPVFGKGAWLISARRSYTDYVRSSLYNDIYGLLTSGQNTARTPGNTIQLRRGGFGGNRNIASGETQPDFYFYDMNSKVTLTPTKKDIFAVSVYSGRDNMDNSQDFGNSLFRNFGGTSDQQSSMKINNITEWGNFGISGKWSRQWNDRYYSHLSVAQSRYFSNYDRSSNLNTEFSRNDSVNYMRGRTGASEQNNTVEDATLRFDNEVHIASINRLRAGLWLTRFDDSYTASLNDTTSLLNRSSEAFLNAIYIQDRLKLFQGFDLTLGVRSTYYNPTQNSYFEPRASFRYEITGHMALKGAWGEYYQFVNHITNENVLETSRDFWLLADNDFKPGYAEHTIAGIEYETAGYLLNIEGYYKNLRNLLEYSARYAANADYGNRFFMGTGISKGAEFLAQKKTGKLTGWIGYTLGKIEHVFPKMNNGSPFPAEHDRTHEVKAVGTFSRGRWNFSATWIYATGSPYTAPESQYFLEMLDGTINSYIHVGDKNSYRLPSYHRMDVSASRRFETGSLQFDFGLSVFNLYNRKNLWYKEFNLDVSPMVVTDVVMLGFTPTLYVQMNIN